MIHCIPSPLQFPPEDERRAHQTSGQRRRRRRRIRRDHREMKPLMISQSDWDDEGSGAAAVRAASRPRGNYATDWHRRCHSTGYCRISAVLFLFLRAFLSIDTLSSPSMVKWGKRSRYSLHCWCQRRTWVLYCVLICWF